jgi:glycosyltransferase involved in cell wall biosynthesis
MAFCEAAAHGLPSLTSNVGGIPTIVRDGSTGYTLPSDAPVSAWADLLSRDVDDPAAYRAMARASRADCEARLNWDAFGRRLLAILERVVAQDPQRGHTHSRPAAP